MKDWLLNFNFVTVLRKYNVKKNMTTCQSLAYRLSDLFCFSVISIPLVMFKFESGAGLGKQTDWCNKCKCREFKVALCVHLYC